ncbi:zinc metallo protein-like proteinase [Xylogone sp. PMI_703]|nr:zinc metallo protein-like proteinase [Xylogone sp. PMI_703]
MEDTTSTNNAEQVSVTVTHHGAPHTFTLPSSSTISDLSDTINAELSIPHENQKFMVAKLGLLKPPFKDPNLSIATLSDKKITLMGSTAAEASTIAKTSADAAQRVSRLSSRPKQTVKAYKSHDWKKEQEESLYTFTTLRPLPHLPNPDRSLKFLQRLKDDAGIKAAMRKHKFSVPLLTEMDPISYTESNHEGTTRILGLNRNKGEAIELRLRTDAYDGYRDYNTIRKTLCHELAHNVWSEHDRNFWDLCHQIEKEVAAADWRSGGHSLGSEEFYEGSGGDEDVDDHGGWVGGEFVVGGGSSAAAGQGLSRREILARAAEERMKKLRDQSGGQSPSRSTDGNA